MICISPLSISTLVLSFLLRFLLLVPIFIIIQRVFIKIGTSDVVATRRIAGSVGSAGRRKRAGLTLAIHTRFYAKARRRHTFPTRLTHLLRQQTARHDYFIPNAGKGPTKNPATEDFRTNPIDRFHTTLCAIFTGSTIAAHLLMTYIYVCVCLFVCGVCARSHYVFSI